MCAQKSLFKPSLDFDLHTYVAVRCYTTERGKGNVQILLSATTL